MDYYKSFVRMRVFSKTQADEIIGNSETAKGVLRREAESAGIEKVRYGLYCAIDAATGNPLADNFAIGSAISGDTFICGRSAFEYSGLCAHSDDVLVYSPSRFTEFTYRGSTFRCCMLTQIARDTSTAIKNGDVIENGANGGTRIAAAELALIQCIDTVSTVDECKEIIDLIKVLGTLDEKRLLRYLSIYDRGFLYQKAGFFFSLTDEAYLSGAFFDECRRGAGKSVRYMLRDLGNADRVFCSEWGLYVPVEIAGRYAFVTPNKRKARISSGSKGVAESKKSKTGAKESPEKRPDRKDEKPRGGEVVWFLD